MEDTQGGGAKKTTIEDFTMLRLLGKGSYGDVFLMEKKDGGGIFALKTMNKMHMARVDLPILLRKRNNTMSLWRRRFFRVLRVLGW